MERKAKLEMIGEFFREGAVLVLVFGFLDKALKGEKPTYLFDWMVLGASGLSLAAGMVIERLRSIHDEGTN